MRSFVVLLFVFALGTCFSVKGSVASQDKDAKKEEKKEEKKQSLVEKNDPESVKILKAILFRDSEKLKFDGKDMAERTAGVLNNAEKLLSAYEKLKERLIKEKKEPPLKEKETAEAVKNTVKEKVKLMKAFEEFTFRVEKNIPDVVCLIEWSVDKGQWTVKEVKLKKQ